jgi:hypothetical protein
MMILSAVVFASFAMAEEALPRPVFYSWCQLGYRFDSYGRGLESAFSGKNLRPRLNDEACFRLGLQKGNELKKAVGVECDRDFRDGRRLGFGVDTPSAGTECFNAGYAAGEAALHVGAREADEKAVGAVCVGEYRRGEKDARNLSVAEPGLGRRPAECYNTGYFDGQMFPGIENQ